MYLWYCCCCLDAVVNLRGWFIVVCCRSASTSPEKSPAAWRYYVFYTQLSTLWHYYDFDR